MHSTSFTGLVTSSFSLTPDPDDLSKDLYNAKAVVVDVSAPRQLLERFLEEYEITTRPLIVIASQAGSNDRKRDLARQIISDCGPSVICGRHGDVYAVSQAVLESGKRARRSGRQTESH